MDNQNSELASPASRSGEEIPASDAGPGTAFPDELLQQLVGTPAGQSATSDGDDEQQGAVDEASLNALAESRGLNLEDVYKATVSLPDEQGTATLEDLKNEATKYRKGEAQREQAAQEQTEFANQKLKYLHELQTAVAALPAEYLQDQEKMAPVAQFLQAQQAQEDRLLLEVIPGWQDEAIKTKENEGIKEFLASEYGAPGASWDQPAPAWAREMVYDYWQLHERMNAIAGKRKTAKSARSTAHEPAGAGRQNRGAQGRANASGDAIDSIVQLLHQE